MDVFLFPSLYEGLPIVLIEAQLSNLKCVVSDTINPIAITSKKTITVSLDKSPSDWARIVIDDEIVNSHYNDINIFNLRNEIKKIEELYQNESFN